MTPEVEALLVDYVREQRDRNGTQHDELVSAVRNVSDQVLAIGSRFDKHEVEEIARHQQLVNALGSHAVRISDLEDATETTGVHELERIKAEKAKLEDEATWSRRWKLSILGTIVAALSVGGASWMASRAWHQVAPPAYAAPR